MRDDSAQILSLSFLWEAIMSSNVLAWAEQGCPLFEVHPAFPLLTIASPHTHTHPIPRCPGGRFWERLSWRRTCLNHVSFCLSDSCQKRFLFSPQKMYTHVHLSDHFGWVSLDVWGLNISCLYLQCHLHSVPICIQSKDFVVVAMWC